MKSLLPAPAHRLARAILFLAILSLPRIGSIL